MKVKQYVYITDADKFLSGDYNFCFSVSNDDSYGYDSWILCGEVDIEVTVDNDAVMKSAIDAIDEQEEKTRAEFEMKMTMLKTKKANLLSITHQP